MKFVSASIHSISLPFKQAFQHNLSSRECSDSFIVSLTGDNGVTGYGEGVARPYVTGESREESAEFIKSNILPVVAEIEIPNLSEGTDLLSMLRRFSMMLPATKAGSHLTYNAAKCAVELAFIDAALKTNNRSVGEFLPPKRTELIYTAVIGFHDSKVTRQIAESCKSFGITEIKIKIGRADDIDRVRLVRDIVGKDVSIRVDANGALTVDSYMRTIENLTPFGIVAVEQPIPRGNSKELAAVTALSPIPVIVDESLLTTEDADNLIQEKACNIFNLRLSKNGGIFSTLDIAAKAMGAGLGVQLGCQVGETSILSAAGRHVAFCLERLDFLEGSYGKLLLADDISEEAVSFSHGGRGQLLSGQGLGVDVCQDRLNKYTQHLSRIELH